jgi:hypothetical protein
LIQLKIVYGQHSYCRLSPLLLLENKKNTKG